LPGNGVTPGRGVSGDAPLWSRGSHRTDAALRPRDPEHRVVRQSGRTLGRRPYPTVLAADAADVW